MNGVAVFSSERLKGIDVFVCVADMGSFTGAAEKLNLTSSAVSKSITRLEGRLKSRLLDRTTRRLALTDAGTAFYRTCTGVLANLEEAELLLQADSTEPKGRVRIDLPASYGRLHALPIILRCVAQNPLLLPHVTFSDRLVDPVEEGIDILVRIGGPDRWPDALERQYIGVERYMFCASPAYLAKHGEPLTEKDLEQHHCIVYGRADGTVNPWRFAGAKAGDSERRVLPGQIAVGDGEGQVIAALAGLGVTQLPTWLVKNELEKGTLVEVLPHLATAGFPLNVVWLKSRQRLPKIRVLLDAFTAELSP